MKFSEQFQITRGSEDDWFDPILPIDTHLFLDPFLLYASETGPFRGSHAEVIAFFNSVFQRIAGSSGDQASLAWKRATDVLAFPEVPELCLGYTTGGTKGAGSGRGFAKLIAAALWDAVRAGVKELTHFEEIGILGEGIGADRISDITACLIRHRLATYTEEVCRRHDVPMSDANFLRGGYDLTTQRWVPLRVQLPRNPHNGEAILLAPRRYLRNLPTINAEDFWDYCYSNENETLRREYGEDVSRSVDKQTIVAFAKHHATIRAEYLAKREERPPEPYNLDRDRKGLVVWYDASSQYVETHPINLEVAREADFTRVHEQMLDAFAQYVEHNSGWELLWNDNHTPRPERAAQNLFMGIVSHYCRANDIDISREANLGRGPVDFKTSRGFRLRALQEVKLANNSRFWNGLEKQLPTYMKAEGIQRGYFIVILQRETDRQRVRGIEERIKAVADETGYEMRHILVNAMRPLSASKL